MAQVYVGCFSESDLNVGRDKTLVARKMAETGLNYTNTKIVYKNGVPAGLKIWVCDQGSFKL